MGPSQAHSSRCRRCVQSSCWCCWAVGGCQPDHWPGPLPPDRRARAHCRHCPPARLPAGAAGAADRQAHHRATYLGPTRTSRQKPIHLPAAPLTLLRCAARHWSALLARSPPRHARDAAASSSRLFAFSEQRLSASVRPPVGTAAACAAAASRHPDHCRHTAAACSALRRPWDAACLRQPDALHGPQSNHSRLNASRLDCRGQFPRLGASLRL